MIKVLSYDRRYYLQTTRLEVSSQGSKYVIITRDHSGNSGKNIVVSSEYNNQEDACVAMEMFVTSGDPAFFVRQARK